MKYFLPNDSYTFGFRFRQPYPNKQPWIGLGIAGKPHLGDDMICNQKQGTATMKGIGKYVWGNGGGHQLHFTPDGTNLLIRFLHLRERPQTGIIQIGDKVFITGNSGTITTIPHLHCDVWDLNNGSLNINNINGFINPSTYNWNSMTFPITFKIKLLANNNNWTTLSQQIEQIKDWYKTKSGGKINLEFTVEQTSFNNLQFVDYDYTPSGFAWAIEKNWQIQNVLPRAVGFDMVIVLINPSEWQGSQTQGVMLGDLSEQKTNVINLRSPEFSDKFSDNLWPFFQYIMCHEISHSFLGMTSQDRVDGINITHKYFYSLDFVDAPKIFESSNYQSLSNVLAVRRRTKGDPMITINNTSDINTKWLLDGSVLRGYATLTAYQKDTLGREVINITLTDSEFNKIPKSQAVIKD